MSIWTAAAGAGDPTPREVKSGLASQPAGLYPARPDRVEVWLDLSEPELARLPPGDRTAREAQLQRITAEQDRVAAALRLLDGVERGRVQLLRNSIAADLPRERIDAVRLIPGVRAVRVVRHVVRPPPVPSE